MTKDNAVSANNPGLPTDQTTNSTNEDQEIIEINGAEYSIAEIRLWARDNGYSLERIEGAKP